MPEEADKLIRKGYREWKAGLPVPEGAHPDEEMIACFLDGRLSRKETEAVKLHLISCDSCAGAFALQLKAGGEWDLFVPEGLLERVRNLFRGGSVSPGLEIVLKLKDKVLELLSTDGDVLVGQELVPAPVLRSRQIRDFKDEIVILKDFAHIRVEIKVENKPAAEAFSLTVVVKEKPEMKIVKDLRVTLLKEDLELESYQSDSGRVTFEHVLWGKYTVAIFNPQARLASIFVEIKK